MLHLILLNSFLIDLPLRLIKNIHKYHKNIYPELNFHDDSLLCVKHLRIS